MKRTRLRNTSELFEAHAELSRMDLSRRIREGWGQPNLQMREMYRMLCLLFWVQALSVLMGFAGFILLLILVVWK